MRGAGEEIRSHVFRQRDVLRAIRRGVCERSGTPRAPVFGGHVGVKNLRHMLHAWIGENAFVLTAHRVRLCGVGKGI